MNDPVSPTAKDRWKGLVGTAALLTFVGLGLWFAVTLLTAEEQQIIHENMTVTGFGMGASYAGNSAIVQVRDAQGLEYPVEAPADIGESCAIGDRIAIIKQGISLKVGPEACAVGTAN